MTTVPHDDNRAVTKGLISIGTNSTRAIVAEFGSEPRIVFKNSIGTRVGEGLRESGRLRQAAMQRTLAAIEELVRESRRHTGDVRAIATSALRRADNADEFTRAVESIAGTHLEIISGVEEARCSYAGATAGLPSSQTYGVLDVGGGSTEYATADAHVSCEAGAVRITEMFPNLRGRTTETELVPPRALIRRALRPLRDFPRVTRLIAVGGSATTACAVLRGARLENAYADLSRRQLQDLIRLLCERSLDERKAMPGMAAQRADILLGGLLIVDEASATTGHDRAIVSTNDVLLGYLLRH